MKLKILTILFILLTNITIYAAPNKIEVGKIKIVTSITPLASIFALLLKDEAVITSIATNSDCPHHYHLKPSDLDKVKKADMVIYIDDQFDGFAAKLMRKHNNNVVNVSDVKELKIINNNWHIWLDLDNVNYLLEAMSVILMERFPALKDNIRTNLAESKKQIANLAEIKQQKLASVSDVILLSDSLEYFFANYKVQSLYNSEQKSLKYLNNLQLVLNNSTSKCLVMSVEQNPKLYKSFKATIVRLASENWPVTEITHDLFYQQYLTMIEQVALCGDEPK